MADPTWTAASKQSNRRGSPTDGRTATIELDGLREGFVYEFHLRELAPRGVLFPSEAYYTLRRLAP